MNNYLIQSEKNFQNKLSGISYGVIKNSMETLLLLKPEELILLNDDTILTSIVGEKKSVIKLIESLDFDIKYGFIDWGFIRSYRRN